MLDPAILQSLDAPLPPAMPDVVQERVWRSDRAALAERLARRAADSFEADVQAWVAALNRRMAEAEAFRPGGHATRDEIARFAAAIEDFETVAELRAEAAARLARRVQRDAKATFAADPSLAAVQRSFGERLIRIDRRVVEAVLDFALYLRAALAEFDPDSRGGPTFDDGADLAAHLDGLLAP